MWLKKSKQGIRSFPFTGTLQALDGHAAVYTVESMASDAIVLHDVPDFAGITGPLKNLTGTGDKRLNDSAIISREDHPEALSARTTAYALTGLRTAAMTSSLRGMHEALYTVAGKRLACVINLTCRAVQRQGSPLQGGHDDYYGAAAAGFVQLFAANVQEVVDFTLIAHRIAELSLTPVICAQDFYRTSHSIQKVAMPGMELINNYLGHSADSIPSPTASQITLFGAQRRRIPVLVDRDHPAGIGAVQDGDSYFKAVAAQRAFFYDHCAALADQAMHEYGELTGRFYQSISAYRTDDADVLVVAQGAVTEELRACVDYLRKQEKIKAGIVNLSILRPFPGARLTHILKGKQAVTVLERTEQPLSGDLPLMQEICSAQNKAFENSNSGPRTRPYPDFETYRQISDKPRLYSAVYGVGSEIPAGRELLAVYRNMLAVDGGKKYYYLDVNFGQADRRFPYLQTLQQSLNKDYPHLQQLSLALNAAAPVSAPDAQAIQIHSLSAQGGLFAGNIFARTLADALQWNVRTIPRGGLEQNMQAVAITLLYNRGQDPLPGCPETFDTVLVSAYKLIENLALLATINKGGLLIIESNRRPEDMWRKLSRQIKQIIQTRSIRLYVIDARRLAAETASSPPFIDQLAVWALLGACLRATGMLPAGANELFRNQLRDQLTLLFSAGHFLIDDILQIMDRAADELSELPWQTWPADKGSVTAEPDSPWTAQQLTDWNNNVFDVTRFWHSVGYLYDSGQAEQALTDPYLATGILPAGSSAFRDITPYRLRIPEWQSEKCTGCGLCWALCPESALPPTVQSLFAIIHNVVTECERQGNAMIQMKRLETQLAKQAYTLVSKDINNQYSSMGVLLQDTFAKLTERMKLEGDKYQELKQEFDLIHKPLEHFNVARTETCFENLHQQDKSSGLLLAISLNPMTCTGCGICVEACPESAFDWTGQTTARVEQYRHNWRLQMKFPGIDSNLIDKFNTTTGPQAPLYRMLDKTAYHSMVGGDGSVPGNSAKTAVHLLTATIESVKRPQFQAHIAYLTGLIDQLEQKIQGKVAGTLNINDFENFTRHISRLEDKDVTIEQLHEVVDSDGGVHTVDQAQLKRLTRLLEKLRRQRQLYQSGAGGAGRARMLINIDPAAAGWNGAYPYNTHTQPWVSHLSGSVPILAEGIFTGVMHSLVQEIKTCRLAELELNDAYVSGQFEELTWMDFTRQERCLIPAVLVICQPGSTAWENISRLLAGRSPIKIAVINNEGISIAPEGEDFSNGQAQPAPTVMGHQPDLLALEYANTCIIQTTVGDPENLVTGIVEAMQHDGPALLHIYAPDPGSGGIAMEKICEHAALAGQSRAFPAFRINRTQSGPSLVIDTNPDPDHDWTSCELDVVEPSGLKSSLATQLTPAHWALREARYQKHFKVLPKGYLSDQMKPLTEYIDLDMDQRAGLEPYIDFTDDNQRHMLAVVSSSMVEVTEQTRGFWRYLRNLAGGGADIADVKPGAAPVEPAQQESTATIDAAAYRQVTDRLLQLCGYTSDPDFFQQSLREFITQAEETHPDDE